MIAAVQYKTDDNNDPESGNFYGCIHISYIIIFQNGFSAVYLFRQETHLLTKQRR